MNTMSKIVGTVLMLGVIVATGFLFMCRDNRCPGISLLLDRITSSREYPLYRETMSEPDPAATPGRDNSDLGKETVAALHPNDKNDSETVIDHQGRAHSYPSDQELMTEEAPLSDPAFVVEEANPVEKARPMKNAISRETLHTLFEKHIEVERILAVKKTGLKDVQE